MIASLRGRVAARSADHVVVECGGVGYRVNVSAQTLREVPAPGSEASLLTHLLMRDDGMHLFGFASAEERQLFLQLISVAGVGPKMALAVLSGSSASEVGRAIAAGDGKRFQVVPGVGKKTAERIIVELRETFAQASEAGVANGAADPWTLAREGLVGLGYDAAEAERMLRAGAGDGAEVAEAAPEELIAAALRGAVGAPA
jgi:holliday junction DNA helicase RuvA